MICSPGIPAFVSIIAPAAVVAWTSSSALAASLSGAPITASPDTIAEQAQTQALAPWVPQNMGFETYSQSKPWSKADPFSTPEHLYLFRIGYNAGFGFGPGAAGVNNDAWVAWIKQGLAEFRKVQPYFLRGLLPDPSLQHGRRNVDRVAVGPP